MSSRSRIGIADICDGDRTAGQEALQDEDVGDVAVAHAAIGGADYVATRCDEGAAQRVKEQIDRFFKLSIDPMCIVGFYGRIQRVNAGFTRVFGYQIEELADLSRSRELIYGGDPDAARERT